MEIKAILTKKVSDQTGVSKTTGNPWQTQEWLLAIPGPHTKRIKVEVRGAERCKQWDEFFNGMPNHSDPVVVKFEIDAREYEGKWYNSLEAWSISMAMGW